MSAVRDVQGDDVRPRAEQSGIDRDDSEFYWHMDLSRNIFPISFSMYYSTAKIRDLHEEIVWRGISVIFKAWNSLLRAMTWLPVNNPIDGPFARYSSMDDTNPGSNFIRRYVDEEAFGRFLDILAESEWYRVQHAMATGGVYVYRGGFT